jgi:O-antigen ligase
MIPTGSAPAASESGGPVAAVIELGDRRKTSGSSAPGPSMGWAAVLVAVVLAAAPLAVGYYNFSIWGPLALGAMVLLIVVSWSARQAITKRGLLAGAGIGTLLALSAASILWAQSKESAWTDTNRLALYAVIFVIGLLSIRDRRVARLIVMLLGLAALLTSVWFPLRFVFGGGTEAFLQHRLDSPIGYINGTAGLLVMGIWPWLALAETAARRVWRAAAFGAAALIAGTFILTESRAVIPATVLSTVLVLACAPGRTRRAVNLLVLAACVAPTLHWTLAVYTTGNLSDAPTQGLVRGAGIAILLAGILAAGCSLALAWVSERVPAGRRGPLAHRLGVAMLVITVLAIAGGGIAERHYISRQWHNFTSLHVSQAPSVRFTDASGFRYDLWRIAIKEFRQHPWGGVGAGNYDTEYYRLRKNPQYIVQPHSLELQMAAELGIGGVLALLLFVGVALGSGFARRGTLASEDLLIRIGALGIFAAWLADTSVDWLYDIPGLAGMAVLAAALLVVPSQSRVATVRRPRRAQVTLVIGLGVLALLAASVGRQYAASRYQASGTAEVRTHPAQALKTLRTADRLDPYSLQTLYELASAYARMDEYPQARDALLVAAEKEPGNYVPPALLGDLAMRRGDFAVAVTSYKRAAQLDPHDQQVQSSLQNAEAAAKRP